MVIPFDRDLVYQEKENLFKDFSRGTSEVRDLLEKEKEDIRFEVFCSNITQQSKSDLCIPPKRNCAVSVLISTFMYL